MGHVEMSKLAKDRADVLVIRGEHRREGKLLYWSSKRGRAKVLLASGAVITVGTDTVVPLNGGNIVADENRVDTQYRNFRSLPADSDGSTEGNEVMPPVRGVVASARPGLGCGEDVSNHVA